MRNRTGQSVLEYAVLVALVSAAFLTMGLYVRRAAQGRIYTIEDQISAKANATPSGTSPGFPPGAVDNGWWW